MVMLEIVINLKILEQPIQLGKLIILLQPLLVGDGHGFKVGDTVQYIPAGTSVQGLGPM